MDTQTTVSQPNIANRAGCVALAAVLALIGSCAAGAFIITPHARQTIITATYTVLGSVVAAAFIFGILTGAEYLLTLRAKRRQEQNKAEFNVYETQTGDLHIRELNRRVDWRAASRDPRVYANGHWVAPTADEVNAFSQWMAIQSKTAATAQVIAAPVQQQLAAPPIDLLDVLRRTRKVLVVGPENAGKTSLLHAIIGQRLSTSAVIVIDPHGNESDWPAGCEVVGPGRRYDLIEQRFADVAHELDRRYKLVAADAANRSGFSPVTIVIDEWSQLVDQVENGAGFIKMMLTESRKVNIAAFVAGHSERVESLGIKGKGDLKAGFGVVRLYYDQVTHQRRQTIDYSDGNGERDAIFTPTGGGIATPQAALSATEIIKPAPAPTPTPEEQTILDMHADGESLNAIARAVYGSTGGKQSAQIRSIISKYPCTV